MTKRLFIIPVAAAMLFFAPSAVCANEAYEAGVMEIADLPEVTITFSDGALQVIGAEGKTLEIVSLTGKRVLQQKIDSPAQKIELNIPKGCYIVKVGTVVRKISVR